MNIVNFDIINNIEEIFDPSKIIELDFVNVYNSCQLYLFTNLRSLVINSENFIVDFKAFLPKMKSFIYLTLPIFRLDELDFIYTECK